MTGSLTGDSLPGVDLKGLLIDISKSKTVDQRRKDMVEGTGG